MTKPITIVGGGLAGLSLGISLRRAEIPVTIFEAATYPRHRVCGEFISGAGARLLPIACGIQAHNAAFFSSNENPIKMDLPEPAICISRYELDALLAAEFQKLGGELRANDRFTATFGEGIVRASGRRRAETDRGHLFGLKAHARGATLRADLELHFKPNRYVGICALENGHANICGLFYSPTPIARLHECWREIFSDVIGKRTFDWDEDSFCAIAGLTLDRFNSPDEFSVGDAAAMIPPLTGNGMSMAFESATLAAPELELFARGKKSWDETLHRHASNWRRAFARRLRWANWTQRLVFHSAGQKLLFLSARIVPSLPRLLFGRTR